MVPWVEVQHAESAKPKSVLQLVIGMFKTQLAVCFLGTMKDMAISSTTVVAKLALPLVWDIGHLGDRTPWILSPLMRPRTAQEAYHGQAMCGRKLLNVTSLGLILNAIRLSGPVDRRFRLSKCL